MVASAERLLPNFAASKALPLSLAGGMPINFVAGSKESAAHAKRRTTCVTRDPRGPPARREAGERRLATGFNIASARARVCTQYTSGPPAPHRSSPVEREGGRGHNGGELAGVRVDPFGQTREISGQIIAGEMGGRGN